MNKSSTNAYKNTKCSRLNWALILGLAISLLGFGAIGLKDAWQAYSNRHQPLKIYQNQNPLPFYQLLKNVQELLNREKIPYSLFAGSLLGAVRHQGLIAWDDDIDLLVLEEKELDLLKIVRPLQDLGYKIERVSFGYKIYQGLKFKLFGRIFTYKMVCLDIFIMEAHFGYYRLADPWAREAWPKEYFHQDELFPLTTYTFGDLRLSGPNNAKPYLTRAFGPNWATQAEKSYHCGRLLQPKISIDLRPEDYLPARPFSPLKNLIH